MHHVRITSRICGSQAKPTVSSCARDRQWRATHAPMPSQVVEVVQETTEPIYRLTRAASPNSLVLCTSAFLGQLLLLPLRVGVFHLHLFHVEVLDVPFIAEMRVIALLSRAIGCESFSFSWIESCGFHSEPLILAMSQKWNQPDTGSFVRFDSR